MLSVERREMIKNILLEKKSITVNEMVGRFGVSGETIRRDLEVLAKEGLCEKTYGGATLASRVGYTFPRRMLSGLMLENKRRLAKAAAQYIRPNDCIFLDHSNTVYELCHEIEKMNLTVMTNSLAVLNALSPLPNIHLILPGGDFSLHEGGFFGLEALRFIEKHSLDLAFFSCKTVNLSKGVGDSTEPVSSLHLAVLEHSDKNYLLADHTKFGHSSFITTCPLQAIDHIITDELLDNAWQKGLRQNHVHYEVAP